MRGLPVLFSRYRGREEGRKLEVRACNKNVIDILILVISSISGLLAKPLVRNLGFPKQKTSGKHIWVKGSWELTFPSAFTRTHTLGVSQATAQRSLGLFSMGYDQHKSGRFSSATFGAHGCLDLVCFFLPIAFFIFSYMKTSLPKNVSNAVLNWSTV